jgi:prepilin-type N-terminal cleavage/methylation domain-containing protein
MQYSENKKQFNSLLYTKGFSLIEVLVSLSIFAVVVTIAVGSLMMLVTANAKARNLSAVMTNISYTLDAMTREIRMGSSYTCGKTASDPKQCPSGSSVFSFNEGGKSLTGVNGGRVAYELAGGVLTRKLLSSGAVLPMTDDSVQITRADFVLTGGSQTDSESPTVTIYIEGTTGDTSDNTSSTFHVQTTVVQQLLDI